MARIAIDYTPAYEQGGGIGRYVRELVAALSAEDTQTDYRLFVAGATGEKLPPAPGPNFTWHPTRITPAWLARIWHRAGIPYPVEGFTGKVNLYHATDFVLPPVQKHTRTLLTVHDLSFVRVPESASPSLKAYLDKVVPRSAQRADHILADSTATKTDLIELYNIPADKITVLLSGVDSRFQRQSDEDVAQARTKYGLDTAPYIFSIGTVQPRKNYVRLIHALKQLHADGYPVHLVIAGGKGWLDDPIYASIAESDLQDFVHFIGFAADEDLPALYSGAECFAFPSLYEGFGLPVLEAMACGTSVLTANVSSLPEVAGDAALLIDPYDTDAIAHGLKTLLSDSEKRHAYVQQGLARAPLFTWRKSAQQLLKIYQTLSS